MLKTGTLIINSTNCYHELYTTVFESKAHNRNHSFIFTPPSLLAVPWLRRFLRHSIGGKIEETGRWGRRRKQLLGDVKEKEKALELERGSSR